MLSIISFIISITLKILLLLFVLFLALIVAIKVLLEPVKGVCKCKTRLDGKVALVTGGNSGIGLETARELARRGATVVIASRDVEKSKAAAAAISASTGNPRVSCLRLDLSSLASVREFAHHVNTTFDRLDILVNNAGCAGLKPRTTKDGIDQVTQINYFGAFLLTNLLLDKLIASKPSRIVIVSSLGHRFCRFDPDDLAGLKLNKQKDSLSIWYIYARSKLYQVMWAKELAKRLPQGVVVNAVHPGIVKTDIFKKLSPALEKVLMFVIDLIFKTAAEGAQTVVHLCVAPELDNASGGYYADCKPRRPARIVKDDKVTAKVWNESLNLTYPK